MVDNCRRLDHHDHMDTDLTDEHLSVVDRLPDGLSPSTGTPGRKGLWPERLLRAEALPGQWLRVAGFRVGLGNASRGLRRQLNAQKKQGLFEYTEAEEDGEGVVYFRYVGPPEEAPTPDRVENDDA